MNALATTPLQYLDRAMGSLRSLGLLQDARSEEAPIVMLLSRIEEVAPDKVAVIARTLAQQSLFNEVVRAEIQQMEVGTRYERIVRDFDSIRDDIKMLIDQLADGKISFSERFANIIMKLTRGDIPTRFQRIAATHKEVSRDTHENIGREQRILEAYMDFRGALKEAEITAIQLYEKAAARLEERRAALGAAGDAIANAGDVDAETRARLELARDERMREMRAEEGRYQIVKDLRDNITVGYNVSEVVMMRLNQVMTAKQRVWEQGVSFFATNEMVFTALSATLTGTLGLHESTQTLNAMKEGVSRSLETLAELGDNIQKAALEAGYGPTVRADAVQKLLDSVISFQEHTITTVDELRRHATRNAEEIRDSVEDGKARLSALIARGSGLTPIGA